jgi:hypothetical protein
LSAYPDSSDQAIPEGGNFATTLSRIKQANGLPTGSPSFVPRRVPSPRAVKPAERIKQLAPSYGVPIDLALKVLGQESGGSHYWQGGGIKTSEKGARGSMQVLPETGRSMGYDVDDPEQNIKAGLDYLGRTYKRWNGDEALTLAGYHSGIEDAEKAFRNPRGNPKTHNYVRSILGDEKYNAALSNYGIGSATQPGAFQQTLQRIKSANRFDDGAGQASTEAPAATGAAGNFAGVLNSIKARLAKPQADWSPERQPTPENTQLMIDELRTNQHVKHEDDSDLPMDSPQAKTATGAAPVPETPETLKAQIDALEQGRRRAVLVTKGETLPALPFGYYTTKTSQGVFIHKPEIKSKEIRRMVQEGTFGELLGHVAPKPATGEPAATVAARSAQGSELQTSVVPPELAGPQAESLQMQFPDAAIEIGGEQTAAGVIADREAALSFDDRQRLPLEDESQFERPQTESSVDLAAREAALSPQNDLPTPTEAQKEAGNYKMGHAKIGGLRISIENPAGSKRRPEWPTLASHYGYFKRSQGADGEHIDTFIRPGTPEDYAGPVFVVDQAKKDGSFDEHKVMLGFPDEESARAGYLENYTPGWQIGPVRGFQSVADFRDWLETADTTKPASQQVKPGELPAATVAAGSSQRDPFKPSNRPTVDNLYARQNVTVTGLGIKNLSPELVKQKTLEALGFTPEDARAEPFEFRIPFEQIKQSVTKEGFLDVQIPDEEYDYLRERANKSQLRAQPVTSPSELQIGGAALIDPFGGTVAQSSGGPVSAQDPKQFLAPDTHALQKGLIQAPVLEHGVSERNAARAPDENSLASYGRDLLAMAPGVADLATRPFQYLSTFVSGLQRRAGAGLGSPVSEASNHALNEYGMRDILDAAAERFYTGKVRPGYEQPVAELTRLAVERFGGNPEDALPKMIAQTLEGVTDPVAVAAMKPGAATGAGVEMIANGKDLLGRIGESLQHFKPSAIPAANSEAGFLLFHAPGKVSKPLEILGAFRKAGLLTGVKTQARNLIGNAAMQGLEEMSRLPASIVDLGVSALTGERTVQGISPAAMAEASRQAVTRGFQEFGQIIKQGATHKQLAALGLPDEIVSGSPILDTFINGSFRFQTAQDAVFKRYALTRSMEEQATLLAKAEARQGMISRGQISSRADEIIQGVGISPSAHATMQARAVEEAAFQTFNNKNQLAEWVDEGIEKLGRGSVKHFFADQIMPFRRTPMNIVNRILDYSPVGVVKGDVRLIKALVNRAFDADEQRAFALAMGRSTVGTATILLGYKLASKGLASGLTGEKDFDKRLWNDTTGRLEGALKIGDKWVEVSRYSPLGNLLALGASIYERSQDDGGNITAKNLWQSAGQIAEEQPLMRTAGSLKDLVTKPGRFGRDALGSFVPSISADVAGQFDSKEREANAWYEGVQKRLPGFRNKLESKIDLLGRDVPSKTGLNPFSISTERKTPALEELERLQVKIDLPPPQPGEGRDHYKERMRNLGAMRAARLSSVVESKGYKEPPDGFDVGKFQRAALIEARRTASDDLSDGREVRRGDEHLILHNARVVVERDRFIGSQRQQAFYKRFSEDQRKEFEQAINEAFGRARAPHTKHVSIGEALDQGRERLNDLLPDRGEMLKAAKQRAARLK